MECRPTVWCWKDQIQRLIKREAEVLDNYENNISSYRQNQGLFITGNEDIDGFIWK